MLQSLSRAANENTLHATVDTSWDDETFEIVAQSVLHMVTVTVQAWHASIWGDTSSSKHQVNTGVKGSKKKSPAGFYPVAFMKGLRELSGSLVAGPGRYGICLQDHWLVACLYSTGLEAVSSWCI